MSSTLTGFFAVFFRFLLVGENVNFFFLRPLQHQLVRNLTLRIRLSPKIVARQGNRMHYFSLRHLQIIVKSVNRSF